MYSLLVQYPLLLGTLKGISVCFKMLKAALCGNYVNFGVFRLYGDDALDKALSMFIKLLVSVPLKSLLVSSLCGCVIAVYVYVYMYVCVRENMYTF